MRPKKGKWGPWGRSWSWRWSEAARLVMSTTMMMTAAHLLGATSVPYR